MGKVFQEKVKMDNGYDREDEPQMLSAVRVLDLTREEGYLCGRILGDLGAEVIKIEPPNGDPGRRFGPFYRDIPHPEKSLHWFAYNANKKGITLKIESADGQEIFRRLAAKADVVVESFPPGTMDQFGLGYEALSRINPAIVMTSISPFGQSGPYAHFKASDIVLMAMGGFMYTCGEPDRAPLRIGFPQAYLFAGSEGAAGTVMALYHRFLRGEGQHVDISAQHSLTGTSTGHGTSFWHMERMILSRAGKYRVGLSAHAKQRQLWPCRDGWVSFQVYGGQAGERSNRAIVEWMDREGFANDDLRAKDWGKFDMHQATQEIMDRIEGPIAEFFLSHTKKELDEGAMKRGLMLYPVCTMADIRHNPQLQARNFWADVVHPELPTSITYPGAWAKCSTHRMPFRRAPLIGEHNVEIYRELGLSDQELSALKQAGVI